MMKKPLLVIGICLLVIAALPVVAEHYTGSGFDLWTVPNSGSSLDMNGGGIHLQDIKGYPFGFYSGSGFEIITGIGALVGTGVTTPEYPDPVGDTGLIRNTRIYRETNDVGAKMKLNWTYETGVTQADIWRYMGPAATTAGDYNTGSAWQKIATTNTAITQYIDSYSGFPIVGDNNNAYYRVVPKDTPTANIFELANNTRTAAKIAVSFPVGAKKLLAIPLYAGLIDDAVRGQVGNSLFYFYPQSGSGLGIYKYENDVLGDVPFTLAPGVGMWVRNSSTTGYTISFVGTAETYNYRQIQEKDLTGNTLPYQVTSATLQGFTDDYIYPQSGAGLGIIKYTGTAWNDSFTLANGAGAWYRHGGTRYWIMDLKNGSQIINTTP